MGVNLSRPKCPDEDKFVLTDKGENAHLKPLAKKFGAADKRVRVSDVFDDCNYHLSKTDDGYRWESSDDIDDEKTAKWVPQGITSTADARKEGTYEGKDGWIVSWHRKDNKSVRVTFVDRKTDKYRHALLVEPHADDDFRAVDVHAGGIVWYGETLWVVDTHRGIRVFDMDNIWRVDDGDGVGKKAGGGYSAQNYKYVIPQMREYLWTGSFEFLFSYISLDRTVSPDRILIGEFRDSDRGRMAQFALDYKTRTLHTGDDKTAKATWAHCPNIPMIQGAVQANGKFYISRSNGLKARGDMFGWRPGKEAYPNPNFFPPGPEDLTYDKRGDRLYGLTEAMNKRYIIPIDAKDVKFDGRDEKLPPWTK